MTVTRRYAAETVAATPAAEEGRHQSDSARWATTAAPVQHPRVRREPHGLGQPFHEPKGVRPHVVREHPIRVVIAGSGQPRDVRASGRRQRRDVTDDS